MKRRDLLAVATGIAFLRVSSVRGQTRLPTIGYLSSNPPDIPAGEVAEFRAGLAEIGFAGEGRDVVIDYRFADGNYDRLSAFAAELVNRHVDVIAASGMPAAVVAKSATASIPIVFIVGVDPVSDGLVETFKAPGRNLTGVTQVVGALVKNSFNSSMNSCPVRRRSGS